MRSRGALALLLAVACCRDPAPVAFEDFSREAENAICDWAVRCRHVPSRQSCERLLDPKDYDSHRARDSIEAGASIYDAEMASRCLETTRDGFCLATPFSDPSCSKVFVGTRAAGEVCTSVRECASGRCTIESCPDQCCEGVCEPAQEPRPPPPAVALGEACQNHGDCEVSAYCETNRRCTSFGARAGDRCLIGCARGDLYCDIESFTCRRFGAFGESCDPNVAESLPCDPAWAVCDGVCRPRPGVGERCNAEDRRCIPSALCDLGSERCVPRKSIGQECTEPDQCDAECDRSRNVCATYAACG